MLFIIPKRTNGLDFLKSIQNLWSFIITLICRDYKLNSWKNFHLALRMTEMSAINFNIYWLSSYGKKFTFFYYTVIMLVEPYIYERA